MNLFLKSSGGFKHLTEKQIKVLPQRTQVITAKLWTLCALLWVLSEGGFIVLIVKFEHFYGDCLVFKDTAPIACVSCSRTLSFHCNHRASVLHYLFLFIRRCFFTFYLNLSLKNSHYIVSPCWKWKLRSAWISRLQVQAAL